MARIRCVVERITYQNPENGYSVQKYGADTFAVIEDNVELLIELEGIGKKRVQMIAQSWEKQKEVKNSMLFLQEHQVSASFAAKIYKQYGNESIAVMKENPSHHAPYSGGGH